MNTRPIRSLPALLLAAAFLTAGTPLAPAQDKPVQTGRHNAWGTYTAFPGGQKVCWALVRPEQQSDRSIRGPAFIMVTSRPADNVWDEVSIVMDFQLGQQADLTVQVGNRTFPMWTLNTGAWIKNPAEEQSLLQMMMSGKSANLTVRASAPKRIADRYSLRGAKQAIEAASRECRNFARAPALSPPPDKAVPAPAPATTAVAPLNMVDLDRCQDAQAPRTDAMAACTHLIASGSVAGPELAGVYLWRGMHRSLDSDHQAAMQDYNAALKLDDRMASAYLYRATLFEFLGDLKRALMDYRAAVSLDPTLPHAADGAKRIEAQLAKLNP